MYLDWKPGDRLVCVDATPPPLMALWFFRGWIRSGQSYTLRQLIIPAPGGPNPGPGVYLAEIRNPIEPESGFEYGYLAYRFEKLEEGTVPLECMSGAKTQVSKGRPVAVRCNHVWGKSRRGPGREKRPQDVSDVVKCHLGPPDAPTALYALLGGKK